MDYKNPLSTSNCAHIDGVAVTPSDTVNLPFIATGLWVGGAGAVSVVLASGVAVTFSAVPAGVLLPIAIQRVNSTGTAASAMVALY